jgi:hypothetical protein
MHHTIVVSAEPSGGGFLAKTKNQPGFWGRGGTHQEAIGDLIIMHPEAFGIDIETTESARRLDESARESRPKKEA